MKNSQWSKLKACMMLLVAASVMYSCFQGTIIDPEPKEPLEIGDEYQGGIIAYILQPGDPGYDANETHGIIAAPRDQLIFNNTDRIKWWNGIYTTTGATGTALGTGQANTTAIVFSQGVGSYTSQYAAQICNDLELSGYNDWYLPSRDELNKLYLNKVAIGGFVSSNYWSSSEQADSSAWFQRFANGDLNYNYKFATYRVRAVRSF